MPPPRPVLLSLLLLGAPPLAGCGPRIAGSPSAESGTDTDTDTPPDPHPEDGEECTVWEGEGYKLLGIMCDGECIDHRNDPEHCGECGNRCETAFGMTRCATDHCTPGRPPLPESCVLPGSELTTCRQVCESYGSPCIDGSFEAGGCGKTTVTYWLDNGLGCGGAEIGRSSEATTCDTTFDFSEIPSIGAAPTGASCCCGFPG